MIAVGKVRRVFVARHRVDFRKAHNGLLAEAYKLGLQPLSGDAIIFIGRDRRRLKLLYSDGNGLWVSYKMFYKSAQKTRFLFVEDPDKKEITLSELSMLIDGARYTLHARPQDLEE